MQSCFGRFTRGELKGKAYYLIHIGPTMINMPAKARREHVELSEECEITNIFQQAHTDEARIGNNRPLV